MPEGVSVIVLDRAGVLLVRRAKPPLLGLWSFPGGALEPGEAVEMGARRELLEETCITVRELMEIGIHRVSAAPDAFRITVFAARHASGEPSPAGDAAETCFVPFERVLTLPLTPGAPGWIVRAVETIWMGGGRALAD